VYIVDDVTTNFLLLFSHLALLASKNTFTHVNFKISLYLVRLASQ